MSNRWMMRLALATTTRPSTTTWTIPVNLSGNPTVTDTWPLQSGGLWAPRSAGSGSGDVFVNQKWNFNLNGAYQLPWDMEVAGNLFGKQGTPYPYYRNAALGREGTQRILVTPELDTIRFDTLWNLDLRWAWNPRFGERARLQFIADLFNVLNSNTEITRERNTPGDDLRRARLQPEPAHRPVRRAAGILGRPFASLAGGPFASLTGRPRLRHGRATRCAKDRRLRAGRGRDRGDSVPLVMYGSGYADSS